MSQTVIPYMSIENAAAAIDFYKRAFGATEVMRHADPDGKVRHAEIQIGNSKIMLHDVFPEFPEMRGVQSYGGSPVNIFLYVDNADTTFNQAVAAGAKPLGPLEDKPYGRSGGLVDPFGLTWWITS